MIWNQNSESLLAVMNRDERTSYQRSLLLIQTCATSLGCSLKILEDLRLFVSLNYVSWSDSPRHNRNNDLISPHHQLYHDCSVHLRGLVKACNYGCIWRCINDTMSGSIRMFLTCVISICKLLEYSFYLCLVVKRGELRA